jgi:hypothetical protein
MPQPMLRAPRRTMSLFVTGTLVVVALGACSTESLRATPPAAVNLSGNWQLNVNLSDDPDRQAPADSEQRHNPSDLSHHGRRGNGGGAPMGPGTGSLLTPAAAGEARLLPAAYGAADATPGTISDSSDVRTTRVRLLQAPARLSIVQQGNSVTVRQTLADGTGYTDRYDGGFHGSIPYGDGGTAERSVGWRGAVFVVTTNIKGGGNREDDFALDEDGRLIMTLQTRGGRLGKNDLARVYDRLRP